MSDPAADSSAAAPQSAPPLIALAAPTPRSARSGLGGALALIAIYVGLLVGIQVVAAVYAMVTKTSPGGAWEMAAQMAAAFGVTLLFVPWLAQLRGREFLSALRLKARWLPGAALLGAGAWGLALELGIVTQRWIPMPELLAREFERLFSDPARIGSLVMLVIVPAVVEEFLCRGLALRAMLRKWRPTTAIVVSALVFGAIHLNPWQFVYATWLGLVFGWAYWRTKSLGLCMLMHAGNNLLSWYVLRQDVPWLGLDLHSDHTPPPHLAPWLVALAVFLVAAGLILLGKATRSQKPSPEPADRSL